jgi:hypothetical protein
MSERLSGIYERVATATQGSSEEAAVVVTADGATTTGNLVDTTA